MLAYVFLTHKTYLFNKTTIKTVHNALVQWYYMPWS